MPGEIVIYLHVAAWIASGEDVAYVAVYESEQPNPQIMVDPHHEFMVWVTRRQERAVEGVELSEIVIPWATHQIVDELIDILRRHEDTYITCMILPMVSIKAMCHAQVLPT
jgi:hypothetical protein